VYMEFPDGEAKSVEWDDWPNECFLHCDATFPFPDGMSACPAGVYCSTGESPDALEELDAEISRVTLRKLNGKITQNPIGRLSNNLKFLVESIAEHATFEGGELARDGYTDLAAYKEYLGEVVSYSPTYISETHGEDEGAGPGGTSGYRLYWDSSPAKALKAFTAHITKDVEELKKL
jgi:hypothetical protein